MKKTILTLAFIVLTLGLFAQTGLFDISYGQNRSDVEKNLKSQGFVVAETNDSEIVFNSPSIAYLNYIGISFDKDNQVDYWEIEYVPKDLEAFFEEMEQTLSEIHGKSRYMRENYLGWLLENDKAVYLMIINDESTEVILKYSDDWLYQTVIDPY